jgi:integrase
MRQILTDMLLRSAAVPLQGRLEIADLRCTGLEFRVTPKNARSFSFRFRDPSTGRLTRALIGRYPDVTLAKAREAADKLRRIVAGGINPVESKRRAKAEGPQRTFAALAERYLEEHARRHKRSAGADERNLRLHILPKWKDRPFDSIRRSDVIELAEGLIKQGSPVQANRIQALVSSIFSFALDADLVQGNPCARLRKRGAETTGTRVLSDGEIRLFWPNVILPPVSRRVGLALRLALLTGTRAGEVAGMARSELADLSNPKKASWTVPAQRSKNGVAHVVPLSPLSCTTIRSVLELIGEKDEFLFPSPTNQGEPITAHALAVAMQRLGPELSGKSEAIKTWKSDPPSPHDLRRTTATRLSSLGVAQEDVAAVLNHIRRDITGRVYDLYQRSQEKRDALNLWSASLTKILRARGAGS